MKEFDAVLSSLVDDKVALPIKVLVDRDVFIGSTIMVLELWVTPTASDMRELSLFYHSSSEREAYVMFSMPWTDKTHHQIIVQFWKDRDGELEMRWTESWVDEYTKCSQDIMVLMDATQTKAFLKYLVNGDDK